MISKKNFCFSCKKKVEDRFFFNRGRNIDHNNQPCPDCGRISERIVDMYDTESDSRKPINIGCLECYPIMKYVPFCDRICHKCFDEKNWDLLKQKNKDEKNLLRVILPASLISISLGLVIGWFLAKKFSKKVNNKKRD